MEADRSLIATLLVGSSLLLATCGVIDRTQPPSSKDDKKRPGPYETWLVVQSVTPDTEEVSTQPRLRIRFNNYLEDDSFGNYNAGSLSSAGLSWGGWADYIVTDRTLVWTPRSSLPDGLEVSFGLADRIESIAGVPVRDGGNLAEYTVNADLDVPDGRSSSAPTWSDVAAIFEDHCNDCHGTARWDGLVPLEYDALVGRTSTQVDRLLVRPFDPADSYLLQKLLEDYPTLRFEAQPPPWSEAEPLTRREKRTVERWIDAGAPR